MTDKLLTIAGQLELEGTIAEIKPLGEGFVNDTYFSRAWKVNMIRCLRL